MGMRLKLLVVMVILAVASTAYFSGALTGLAVGGGGTEGAGEKQKGNPNYGAIKGYLTLVIRDTTGTVINTEAPTTNFTVYFVPTGEDIDWLQPVVCNETINGALTSVDADDADGTCTSLTYPTPTVHTCYAIHSNESQIPIYRTFTSTTAGNQGCFASKLPAGSYDVYT